MYRFLRVRLIFLRDASVFKFHFSIPYYFLGATNIIFIIIIILVCVGMYYIPKWYFLLIRLLL